MKKLLYLFGAMALMLGMVACGEEPNGGDLGDDFLDDKVLAGFYVYGPATGADNVVPDNMMARGYNEVDKEYRAGMYEKYIWLHGGQDFWLASYEGGELYYYSAILADVDLSQYDENPQGVIKSGKLMDESEVPAGMELPAMQVEKDGFYHIIFDTNIAQPQMPQAQIIVMPVDWYINGGNVLAEDKKGVREVKEEGDVITWTWAEVELSAGAAFKFKYDPSAWKINLDSSGNVKAEISLGDKFDGENGLSNTTDKNISEYNDIILDGEAGVYEVKLHFNKTQGEVGDSFKYELNYVRELDSFLVGGYDLVTLHKDSKKDAAWSIKYLTAGTTLDAVAKTWNKETKQFDTATVATVTVENTGLTLIYFDNATENISLSEAKVYGTSPVFSGVADNWPEGQADCLFTVNPDGTVTSPAVKMAGQPRQYVAIEGASWWQAEFSLVNDVIVYRGNGGECHGGAEALEVGQTFTLDFNNGIGWINK